MYAEEVSNSGLAFQFFPELQNYHIVLCLGHSSSKGHDHVPNPVQYDTGGKKASYGMGSLPLPQEHVWAGSFGNVHLSVSFLWFMQPL